MVMDCLVRLGIAGAFFFKRRGPIVKLAGSNE